MSESLSVFLTEQATNRLDARLPGPAVPGVLSKAFAASGTLHSTQCQIHKYSPYERSQSTTSRSHMSRYPLASCQLVRALVQRSSKWKHEMYNLIMCAVDGYWEESPATIVKDRIFEYTPKLLVDRFGELEPPELDEMLDLPSLFSYEHGLNSDARIGRITKFRKRHTEVRIEFEFDPALPAISASDLKRLEWELDIGEWEFNRTHWAIKDVDLFEELMDAELVTKRQRAESFFEEPVQRSDDMEFLAQPAVFRVPREGIQNDLVSVMRPFRPDFDDVQATLDEACAENGLSCMDANRVWNETEVFQDIFSLIYRSRVVICDFSGKNPNVFYELGIAHTLGRAVIPIVQNPEDVPFDLQHHRYIRYLPNAEGLSSLRAQVSRRLESLLRR